MEAEILDVRGLRTDFHTYEGVVKALDEISFSLNKGETLGIVGETGCGKTVAMLSILQLVLPPGKIESGSAFFRSAGRLIDLITQSETTMRSIRGNEISLIFQEASSALNPVLTIGSQVSEAFLLHRQSDLCERVLKGIWERLEGARGIRKLILLAARRRYLRKLGKASTNSLGGSGYGVLLKREALSASASLLECLGIPNPREAVRRYPHELSGGMQQRVVISMALACSPKVLIADEPTSNLDVTIQAQILELIDRLKDSYRSQVVFITHDLGVVSEMADRVIVLYAGELVETAPVKELFAKPLHPYTKALLRSVPKPGVRERLESIGGSVPNLVEPPSGCRFHPRCPHVMDVCMVRKPPLFERVESSGAGHTAACFLLAGAKTE